MPDRGVVNNALLAVGLLVSAAALGSMASVGAAPWLSIALHLILLGLSILSVRHLGIRWILPLAILVRLAFLPMLPAGDLNRYAWEGHIQQSGVNPFTSAPDQLDHLSTSYSDTVSHPDKTAIYPPLAQVLFRLTATVAGEHNQPALYKQLALGADILVVVVLWSLLGAMQRRRSWLALYAFNPVILWSFAGEGHLDVFMLLFIACALLAWQRGWWPLMWLALGAAFQIKYMALFLVPCMLQRRSWRWAPLWAVTGLLPFLLYGPPFEPIFATLKLFSRDFHYNSAIHPALSRLLGEHWLAARVCALLMPIGVLIIRLFRAHPLESGLWVMGWIVICSPTVHLWYLAWVLLFLPLRPSAFWLAVSGSIAITYLNVAFWWETGGWEPIGHLGWIVWGIPLLTLLWRGCPAVAEDARLHDARPLGPRKTLSILMPMRNEAEQLPAFFDALDASQIAPHEVLVADAASSDDSVAIARARGATVLQAPAGRGRQIAAATKAASGDVLFIAHADMLIAPDTIGRVLSSMQESGKPGGAVGCTFANKPGLLPLIEGLNRIRASWGGISFGDQGQFVERAWLLAHGGIQEGELMEDVELSLRLKEDEHPLYLGHGITASDRSWQGPQSGRARLIIWLVARYLGERFLRRGPVNTAVYAKAYRQNSASRSGS